MLAEPRSRRSYTLVPKGKPLYEDETRFGTKLMQKMGWTKGKGLGRDESGSKDFLRVRYKNDAKGFGFEARDDQWTQHEQSFNGLLSTLNGNEEAENENLSKTKASSGDVTDEEAPRLGFGFQDTTAKEKIQPKLNKVTKLKEKISGVSLEEKSKKSRARVHYQKFTRGKDLSQYSEKDLANIFGKKIDESIEPINQQEEQANNVDETINEENNVQFLHSGISVADYFKMKMQAKRNQLEDGSKTNANEANGCIENNGAIDEDQQEERVSKKKNKKKKKSKDVENEENLELEIVQKKEKKSKKDKHKALESENVNDEQNRFTNLEIVEIEQQKPKKNKKSKNKTQEYLQTEDKQLENELEGKVKGNKRKKDDLENEHKEHTDEPQQKKHKKQKKDKKNKDHTKADVISMETETSNQETSKEEQEIKTNDEEEEDHKVPKNKKSNKNKKKDVSCNANDVLTKEANKQELKLDEIEKLHNSYNVYTISSFCAEKFRNLNFNDFKGSILSQIEGYGFNKDLQLDVQVNKHDEERITNLWKGVLDKYANLQKPKKTYHQYVQEVRKARSMKRRGPKLYVKTWKRKNAFQII